MFRNKFVLILIFTILFAGPLVAEDEVAAPAKDAAQSTDTDKESKAEEKASKEDATEKKDELPKDDAADESKKEEADADSKDDSKEEAKKEEEPASQEAAKKEEEPAPQEEAKKEANVEAEMKAEAAAAEKAVEAKTGKEEKAPEVDLKAAASTEKGAEEGEKKKEKPKRFSVFINNAFMNTQDSARPVFRYALTGGFGVRLPWKIGFKFSLGLYTSVAYKRPQSGSTSSGKTGYDALLNRNLTTAAFDGTPLVFAFNRPFQLPWKMTLIPSIKSTLSVTSKYLWNMEIYSKLFLGLTLAKSFELKKNTSISTSLTAIYNVTFNGKEWIGSDVAPMKIGRNPQTLIYSANTGINYKSFNFGITWTQAFVYLRNGSWEVDQNPEFPTNDGVDRVMWSTINSLQMDASYSIKGFAFSVFVVTEGPWTLFYTGPSWYPFRPDMTTYGLTVGYNYAF